MNTEQIIEAALLSSAEPLTIEQLLNLFDDHEQISKTDIQQALKQLSDHYADRAIELTETAGGVQIQVKATIAHRIQRLWEEKPPSYSKAMLETLAIIAYRQPVTRGDIESIRGVSVSSPMMKTLQEHHWIRRIGHRDVPGRPSLYATTKQFLDHFGLKSLEELPSLETFEQTIEKTPEILKLFEE